MNRSLHAKKQSETKAYNLSLRDKQALLETLPAEFSPWVDLASTIGVARLEEVLQVFRGEKIHVASPENFWSNIARTLRNNEIRALFHPRDYGYERLACEFSGFMGLSTLSARHVREIIHAKQRPHNRKRKPERQAVIKVEPDQKSRIARLAQTTGLPQSAVLDAMLHALDGGRLQVELSKRVDASHNDKRPTLCLAK